MFLSEVLVQTDQTNQTKQYPKVPEFPFHYNSVWELGGRKYDSNIGDEIQMDVVEKFDVIESESEVEIFHDPLDKQVTKLPSHHSHLNNLQDKVDEDEGTEGGDAAAEAQE